jgi:hypothetical protein
LPLFSRFLCFLLGGPQLLNADFLNFLSSGNAGIDLLLDLLFRSPPALAAPHGVSIV